VVVGDFNGDGNLDFAGVGPADSVSVLLGNGDGTFQPAVQFMARIGPVSLAIGDFNGDGKADLVVANYGTAGSGGENGSDNVTVMLGNGNGTLQTAVSYAAGRQPMFVAVGDFNGDGRADLVVLNSNGANVSVLLANAAGLSTVTTLLPATPNPSQYGQPVTLIADVAPSNATGQVEFLDGSNVVGVGTLNLAGSAQISIRSLPSGATSLRAVYAGVPGVWLPSQSGAVNQVVNPVAPSGLAAAISYAAGSHPNSVTAGDFNGDGKADLAVANFGSNDVSILLGIGNGTFRMAVNYAVGIHPYSAAVGDFNGDGKPDLAVANWGSMPGSVSNVSVLLGNGDGTFQAAINYTAGTNPQSVAVADFNGDGKPDLVVANWGSGDFSVFLGNGDGTFRPALGFKTGLVADGSPVSVAVGDFNGDGFADAVAALDGSATGVLLGYGDGTLQPTINYLAGTNPDLFYIGGIAVGDFNGRQAGSGGGQSE